MAQLKIKEFSTGKLYISEEAAKTATLKIDDVNGKPTEIFLSEAINMCIFPSQLQVNLKNQMTFLASLKSAGILPKVVVYELTSKNTDAHAMHILFITGPCNEYIQYEKMFYLPQAESIFENLFHSQNWSLINPESSYGNVAREGYGISTLDHFDDLIRKIRKGDYYIQETIQ